MVTTKLDGISLVNHRRFTKFATNFLPTKLLHYTVLHIYKMAN